MQTERMTETDHIAAARERLIEAALPHVVFDGWTAETLRRAVADSGVDDGLAHLAFPRGGVDMALGYHRLLDRRLAAELGRNDLRSMKIRDRIAHAVRRRLELVDGQMQVESTPGDGTKIVIECPLSGESG